MQINRDQFIEEGYIILPQVIPPDHLETLRAAYEIMVERQRAIWARERKPGDPPGGAWETGPQPRLVLGEIADQINDRTAAVVEFWLHENMQGVSSELLGVEDAGVTQMMLMCNPVRSRGTAAHRGWHRDLYPPRCAPLQSYAADIVENGPRYVQWNLPLYDDDVLWVLPGSHVRPLTREENEQLHKDPRVPLPGGVQTKLKAGDGVVYILPLLHWGSKYDNKLRRTIHGGFSVFTHYPDLCFLEHLSAATRDAFTRWDRRNAQLQDCTERVLRAAIEKNAKGYCDSLEELHPGRGAKGQLQSTICLSKVAKRIHQLKSPDFERLPANQRKYATSVHATALQWGGAFADRFSDEEAHSAWARFKPVDDAMQTQEEQWAPGFQGEPTSYYFNEVPEGLSVESFTAGW